MDVATMNPGGNINAPDEPSNFYFYNPTNVEFGKKDFIARWGNRELSDNWRWSGGKSTKSNVDADDDLEMDDMVLDADKELVTNPLYGAKFLF